MQLAIVALCILTLEVIDTIGYVACLLNLCQETACTDRVNTTCWQEEYIAFLHRIFRQSLSNGVIFNHFLVLFWCNLLLQTAAERGISITFHHIPHLSLTTTQTLCLCLLVCWVNLNRKLLACINELNKQRELITKAFIVLLTHQFILQSLNKFVQCPAFIFAIRDNTLVVLNT